MKLYTTEKIPEGYALVRHSFFNWGWVTIRENQDFGKGFHSFSRFCTSSGAKTDAIEHKAFTDKYKMVQWE